MPPTLKRTLSLHLLHAAALASPVPRMQDDATPALHDNKKVDLPPAPLVSSTNNATDTLSGTPRESNDARLVSKL